MAIALQAYGSYASVYSAGDKTDSNYFTTTAAAGGTDRCLVCLLTTQGAPALPGEPGFVGTGQIGVDGAASVAPTDFLPQGGNTTSYIYTWAFTGALPDSIPLEVFGNLYYNGYPPGPTPPQFTDYILMWASFSGVDQASPVTWTQASSGLLKTKMGRGPGSGIATGPVVDTDEAIYAGLCGLYNSSSFSAYTATETGAVTDFGGPPATRYEPANGYLGQHAYRFGDGADTWDLYWSFSDSVFSRVAFAILNPSTVVRRSHHFATIFG